MISVQSRTPSTGGSTQLYTTEGGVWLRLGSALFFSKMATGCRRISGITLLYCCYTKREMKRVYVFLSLLVVLLVATATVLYLRGVPIPILEPAGPIALAERNIIFITLALCAIVVIPVFFLLFYFAWKYRAGGPAGIWHEPNWDHDNATAEFIWWLVPAVIIVVLGVIMWQSAHALDPYVPIKSSTPALTVDVVALDWKWLFIYPEQGIASVNLLEIPENTPVHFYLTADAPMNSFWIPSLGGQIMVMPGMQTQLNLLASREGDFNGYSANISGEGFAGMAFTARSVSQAEFDQWAASIASSSNPLTPATFHALSQPSSYNTPTFYAPITPSLYTGIINTYMSPGMSGMNMPASSSASMPSMSNMPNMPGMQMP